MIATAARPVPDSRSPAVVRTSVAAAGVAVALASAAWIVPAEWPTYAVCFAFAFAFSFVWLDSDAPTSVPHMATATAFVYIGGFPTLFVELAARSCAYPILYLAWRHAWRPLPRPLRPLVQADEARAHVARLDLAAMLGLATIGAAVRVGVVQLGRAGGVESLLAMVVVGEPTAYAVMGALSAWLPLPTGEYVVAAPHRLPAEDERVDVIFSAVLIVPLLVLLNVCGYVLYGLPGVAAFAVTSIAPHALVQMLIRRRHQLDAQHLAVQRKQAELEAFAYAVTHDLRPPVAGITQHADALLAARTYEVPDEARVEVKGIARLAAKMDAMIRALLNMARIVGAPEPVATVDLGAVVAEAIELLRPQIVARRIRVDVTTPLPAVPGQAVKLGHVFTNLIANAIRFVPEGSGSIEVSATRQDGAVVVAVRDNGIGVPAEYRRVIFEIFRRAPDGDGDGSGMGLAIVKRIVEGHGGVVWVESGAEAGAVFLVRLPAT